MKIGIEFFQSLTRQKLIKYLVEEQVIMNWNILTKCRLILVFGAAMHLLWILWKLVILFIPELMQWVNVPLMRMQLWINFSFLALHIFLLYPCYRWRQSLWAQKILPFIVVGIFIISLLRDGYLTGVLSPVVMISYISLVTVGCVLLPRSIVYTAFIPTTFFLLLFAYLSYQQMMPYAPLFLFEPGYYHLNGFWLLSMLYGILPILITCMILFEILLSQWRHREALIQHLSEIDPLTNIYNRRSINDALSNLDHLAVHSYALVLLDLDHFKVINDRYGHHKGDEALVQVSEVLKHELRGSDVVGRFGGEEFILVLKNSSLQQAQIIAERCRSRIEALQLQSDQAQAIQITASFGVAISHPNMHPQQLLSYADKALYQAKAAGRNRVVCYTD